MIKKINSMLVVAIALSGNFAVAADASASDSDSGWKKKIWPTVGVVSAVVVAALAVNSYLNTSRGSGNQLGSSVPHAAPASDAAGRGAVPSPATKAVDSAMSRVAEDRIAVINADIAALRVVLAGKASSDELVKLVAGIKIDLNVLGTSLESVRTMQDHDKTDRERWTKQLGDTEAGLKAKINELSDRVTKLAIIRRANESLDLSKKQDAIKTSPQLEGEHHVRFGASQSSVTRDAGDVTPASLAVPPLMLAPTSDSVASLAQVATATT